MRMLSVSVLAVAIDFSGCVLIQSEYILTLTLLYSRVLHQYQNVGKVRFLECI